MVRVKTGAIDQAKAFFSQAAKASSERFEAIIELAELLINSRQYDSAIAYLESLDFSLISDAYYLYKAGQCFQRLQKLEQADVVLSKACELQPDNATILTLQVAVSSSLGKLEKASSICKNILAKQPLNQKLHYDLSVLATAKEESHVEQMLKLKQTISSGQGNSVFLDYALGKEYEDLAQWDKAFEHYESGGAQAKHLGSYTVDGDLKFLHTMKSVFDEDCCNAETQPLSEVTSPIFVTGFPRSGTTLLDKILSSHSEIESADESFFFQVALQLEAGLKPLATPSSDSLRQLSKTEPANVGQRYLNLINHRLTGSRYFIEKLPENFLYLGLVAASMPHAKLIFVKRHPMDVCFALFKQPFFRYAFDLTDLAKYYIAADQLINYWIDILGDRLTVVSYESLTHFPERTVKTLFKQLDIPYESQCLHFYQTQSATSSASKAQIRQPIHTRSVGKWRCFENHLSPLAKMLDEAGIDIS
nr:tetratricopeptide repeat-containing sulfotransferase family protein [Alteromonas sp. ASW11-130]